MITRDYCDIIYNHENNSLYQKLELRYCIVYLAITETTKRTLNEKPKPEFSLQSL